MRFSAVRDADVYFKAHAEASKTRIVKAKEQITLTSNIIVDDAKYTWYNKAGDVVGNGSQITITPTESQTYKMEIVKAFDGYKSYDEVNITAVDGAISNLSPNPAREKVLVEYNLSDNASNATIQISDIQNIISISYPISVNNSRIEIPLSTFASGNYIVKLLINGVVVDSKQLLKH